MTWRLIKNTEVTSWLNDRIWSLYFYEMAPNDSVTYQSLQTAVLKQELTNYSLKSKASHYFFVFVSQDLLEHSPHIYLGIVCDSFYTKTVGLSNCNRDQEFYSYKAENPAYLSSSLLGESAILSVELSLSRLKHKI